MRTIIVGAGIAGLVLAERLARAGDDVLVLEKYDYVGGRILTASDGRELGAGRVFNTHKRTHALLRRFHLKTHPIDHHVQWRALGADTSEPNEFEAVAAAFLKQLALLPPTTLATHTIHELTTRLLGPSAARALLTRFPYRGETEALRADLALRSFAAEMGTHTGYTVVRGGLGAIPKGLAAAAEAAGATIRLNADVVHIQPVGPTRTLVHMKGAAEPEVADRVILAVHASALRRIPLFRTWWPLRHLRMLPLVRIYAKYPPGSPWLKTLGRTVSNSPLRYIIPVDPANGVVMISYTEGADATPWLAASADVLPAAIQHEVRRLFPEHRIPEPEWVKRAPWTHGCTYWLPGRYDPAAASAAALQPFRRHPRIHVVGESFSLRQAWIEGALEHADALWAHLKHGPT
jgi:monoamine oxidase